MEDGGAAPTKRQQLSIKTARDSGAAGGGGWKLISGEKRREEEEEEPVSPGGRLFHQRGFDCYVVGIMGFSTLIDVAALKHGLDSTLARHPRFRTIPVLDETGGTKSRWVPTKVAVEDHIVIPNLDPRDGDGSGSDVSPDQVVEDYVSHLTSCPMDHSRPLWEIHVLNFPTSDAAAVAVLRLHHCLGDGASLMSLILACARKASDPNSVPTLPGARRRQWSSANATKPNAPFALTLLLWLWASLVLVWNTLVDIALFTATTFFLKDTRTPLRGSMGTEFRPRRIVHRTVSLDDIKGVKEAVGCTVNDVLVGLTSAALTRYLARRYEKGFRSNIRLRSTLLVNIRPVPGIHDLAELMEGRDGGTKWGNLIGYMILPLTICKLEDPLDYVRRSKAISEKKKNSLEAIFTFKSGDLIVKCFGIKAAANLCRRVLSHTTLSLSNMVGPIEEVEFFGHRLVYIAASTYGHPQALTLHFQSYVNAMKIVAAVDEEVIQDPHQLVDDFADSLKLMKEALQVKLNHGKENKLRKAE